MWGGRGGSGPEEREGRGGGGGGGCRKGTRTGVQLCERGGVLRLLLVCIAGAQRLSWQRAIENMQTGGKGRS